MCGNIMQYEYLDQIEQKLQNRIARIEASDEYTFYPHLCSYFTLLRFETVFCVLSEALILKYPKVNDQIREVIGGKRAKYSLENMAAIGYLLLNESEAQADPRQFILTIGQYQTSATSPKVWLDAFVGHFLIPLHTYLVENLNSELFMLCALRKYKQRTEWFRREAVLALYKSDTRRGEKNLMLNLYEFLFDQGIDFVIAPWSVAGAPDLVAAQTGENKLVADGKVFDTSKGYGKRRIIEGFRQVYDYACQFHKPIGILVIYRVCSRELRFLLPCKNSSFPYYVLNNKTIYFVEIDICPYKETASNRGKLEAENINEKDLVDAVIEE
jgi:hypothetical protein